jgi:hypothetical protein
VLQLVRAVLFANTEPFSDMLARQRGDPDKGLAERNR